MCGEMAACGHGRPSLQWAMTNPDLMPSRDIAVLLEVMKRLRDGCPWDKVQTFETIAPYTIEEAYEVASAIADKDMKSLPGELGDLLFQVVFHARMAQEQGAFDFDDVAAAMVDKMVRRHPHVFAGQTYADVAEQTAAWETIKADERAAKGRAVSLLDDVPASLPGLTRAVKLTKRAARIGFDWPSTDQVLAKLREELEELQVEIDAGDLPKARAELGDLLFVCANLARKLEVDPEDSLRAANAKFARRFSYIEKVLAERGSSPEQSTLEEMDALWDEAKALERRTL